MIGRISPVMWLEQQGRARNTKAAAISFVRGLVLAICDPLPLLYPELFHDRFGVVADLGNRGIDLGSRFFETLAPMPREILAG